MVLLVVLVTMCPESLGLQRSENQVSNSGKEVGSVGRGGAAGGLLVCLFHPSNYLVDKVEHGVPRGKDRGFDDQGLGEVEKLGHSGVEDFVRRIPSRRPRQNGQVVVDAASRGLLDQGPSVLLLGGVPSALLKIHVILLNGHSTRQVSVFVSTSVRRAVGKAGAPPVLTRTEPNLLCILTRWIETPGRSLPAKTSSQASCCQGNTFGEPYRAICQVLRRSI